MRVYMYTHITCAKYERMHACMHAYTSIIHACKYINMCVHRCMYKHILPQGAFVAARREMGSLLHVFVLFLRHLVLLCHAFPRLKALVEKSFLPPCVCVCVCVHTYTYICVHIYFRLHLSPSLKLPKPGQIRRRDECRREPQHQKTINRRHEAMSLNPKPKP